MFLQIITTKNIIDVREIKHNRRVGGCLNSGFEHLKYKYKQKFLILGSAHNLKEIRENLEHFKTSLSHRNSEVNYDQILDLDKKNRQLIQEKEKLEQEKKSISKLKILLSVVAISLPGFVSRSLRFILCTTRGSVWIWVSGFISG